MDVLSAMIAKAAAIIGLSSAEFVLALFISTPIAGVLGWILLPKLAPSILPRAPKPFPTITPQNTIFAIDLHEVLMHPNYFAMIAKILFTRVGWQMLHSLLRPTNLGDILTLAKRPYGLVSEEIIHILSRHPESRHLREPLVQVVNSFYADQQMVSTLAELKALGYRIILFSNIGEICLEDITAKHSSVFASFDGMHCTQRQHQYVKKPDPRAFQLFLSKFASTSTLQFVLLDDKKSNIMAASAASPQMRGCVFWSASKFRRDLQHWGVLS